MASRCSAANTEHSRGTLLVAASLPACVQRRSAGTYLPIGRAALHVRAQQVACAQVDQAKLLHEPRALRALAAAWAAQHKDHLAHVGATAAAAWSAEERLSWHSTVSNAGAKPLCSSNLPCSCRVAWWAGRRARP